MFLAVMIGNENCVEDKTKFACNKQIYKKDVQMWIQNSRIKNRLTVEASAATVYD